MEKLYIINLKVLNISIHHYDADGLSAGAITCSALVKMGKDYTRDSFKRIGEKEVQEIKMKKEKNIRFRWRCRRRT